MKRTKPRLLELKVNSTFIGLCCWSNLCCSRCCCCCCYFCFAISLSYSSRPSSRMKRIKPRSLKRNVNITFTGFRCCCCRCCCCWAAEEGLRRVHRTKCCVSLQDVPVAIAATTVALSAASIRVHPLPQAPSHERLFLPSPQRQPQQLAAPIVRKPNARLHAGGEEQDHVRRCFDQDPVRVVLGKGG